MPRDALRHSGRLKGLLHRRACLWQDGGSLIRRKLSGVSSPLDCSFSSSPPKVSVALQVQLTTSDWDQCGSWLTAVRRLINMSLHRDPFHAGIGEALIKVHS